MPMAAGVTSLLTLPFLSVRMVLTEWPEGSWGPVCLKGDVGFSFCSSGTEKAMQELASLPVDSAVSLDAFAHPRSSHQLAVCSPLGHTGQRGNMPSPLPRLI